MPTSFTIYSSHLPLPNPTSVFDQQYQWIENLKKQTKKYFGLFSRYLIFPLNNCKIH